MRTPGEVPGAGALGLLGVSETRVRPRETDAHEIMEGWGLHAEHVGREAMTGIKQGSNQMGFLYVPESFLKPVGISK